MPRFFAPTQYENPLTEQGRARTIAAFHIAQGDIVSLSEMNEMRRDVLNKLMSPRAVGYWLNDKEWLRLGRKVGKIQMLHLTADGLRTCINSAAGGSEVPTTPELIRSRTQAMLHGGYGLNETIFPELS